MYTISGTECCSLKLKCCYDEVGKLHQFLHDSIRDICGEPTEKRLSSSIVLAVHEAFTNVVRHACIDGEDEEIQLFCKTEKRGIVIELIDRGVAFNPLESPTIFGSNLCGELQEIEDVNELKEGKLAGGYGIPIIQAAATSTRYRRSKSGNNHLNLYFEVY